MTDLFTFLTWVQFLTFVSGGLILNLIPGSDVLTATAFGLKGGPKAGAASGFGTGLGSLVHVLLAALGLAAMIAAHPITLDAIRWIGAGYLLWLGYKSWTASAATNTPSVESKSALQIVIKGALTNILNPKPIIFVLAYLPQFIVANGPAPEVQILLLGFVFCVTGTIVTMGYGILAGFAGRGLTARMGLLNKLAGVVFGGLALRLATSG